MDTQVSETAESTRKNRDTDDAESERYAEQTSDYTADYRGYYRLSGCVTEHTEDTAANRKRIATAR
jgi:hypothetical protein